MRHATGLFSRPSDGHLNCLEGSVSDYKMDDFKGSRQGALSPHHQNHPFMSASSRRLVGDASVDSNKSSFNNSLDVHSSASQQKSGLSYYFDKIRTHLTKNSDDSNLRRYWMPDNNSKECYDCGKCSFTKPTTHLKLYHSLFN